MSEALPILGCLALFLLVLPVLAFVLARRTRKETRQVQAQIAELTGRIARLEQERPGFSPSAGASYDPEASLGATAASSDTLRSPEIVSTPPVREPATAAPPMEPPPSVPPSRAPLAPPRAARPAFDWEGLISVFQH
ncbi:MAG: hypothetical protein ABJC61_01020 [Acidobacteriota bacterium]